MQKYDLNKEKIDAYIDTASVCFFDYPLNAYLYKDIEKGSEFYRSQSRTTLKKSIKRNELHLLENNPKALMFVRYSSLNALIMLIDMMPIFISAFFRLKLKDVHVIFRRYRKIKLIYRPHWQEEYVGKDYYHLIMIAVHPDLQGTGAFRKLLSPLLNRADTENKPIILETHNPKLIDLYMHFGFTLVQTLTHDQFELSQYCMIRYPDSSK